MAKTYIDTSSLTEPLKDITQSIERLGKAVSAAGDSLSAWQRVVDTWINDEERQMTPFQLHHFRLFRAYGVDVYTALKIVRLLKGYAAPRQAVH